MIWRVCPECDHTQNYEITNVPGRTAILMHTGNLHNHTSGCLLPGEDYGIENGDYRTYYSTNMLDAIYNFLHTIAMVYKDQMFN